MCLPASRFLGNKVRVQRSTSCLAVDLAVHFTGGDLLVYAPLELLFLYHILGS